MLNFRTANKYLVIFAVMAILLMIFSLKYFWLLIILLIVYLYLLVDGSIKVCSNFYTDIICKGAAEEKILSLTFDDGPDAEHTPEILDILEKHQVPATFFIIGHKAEKNETLIRDIVKKGHGIGNHSFSHAFFFDLFGRKKIEQDLQKTDDFIEAITGKKNRLFRPPYGVTNPALAKVARQMEYKVIGWSVRSLDTVLKDEEKMMDRISDRLHPGAIILMHDDREITLQVLDKLIVMIKKEGYRFVELKEIMISLDNQPQRHQDTK